VTPNLPRSRVVVRQRIHDALAELRAALSRNQTRRLRRMFLALPGTMRRMAPTAERSMSQLRRGVLEYCVLALLRRRRYGVELLRELGKVELMATSEGTIYPLLSRLRREGLVEATWQESSSGPPRRYYELALAGAQALDEFANEWPHFNDAVLQFLSTKEAFDHDARPPRESHPRRVPGRAGARRG
jgi:PadR family transcriptional regulator, regulatory protein PadR